MTPQEPATATQMLDAMVRQALGDLMLRNLKLQAENEALKAKLAVEPAVNGFQPTA
jgi:regulator of replication initiation timing